MKTRLIRLWRTTSPRGAGWDKSPPPSAARTPPPLGRGRSAEMSRACASSQQTPLSHVVEEEGVDGGVGLDGEGGDFAAGAEVSQVFAVR